MKTASTQARRQACQPSQAPAIAISVTSPKPIASRPSAREAPARTAQIMPAATVRPTSAVTSPAQWWPPASQAATIPPPPPRAIRGLSHMGHGSVGPSAGSVAVGGRPNHHQMAKPRSIAARPAAPDSHSGRPAPPSGPKAPSTSAAIVGGAKERSTARPTGRSVAGRLAFQARPASTPGTVTASGITRCRRSIHDAAARNVKRIRWATSRRPMVVASAVARPEGICPRLTISHHHPAVASPTAVTSITGKRAAPPSRSWRIAARPRRSSRPRMNAAGSKAMSSPPP